MFSVLGLRFCLGRTSRTVCVRTRLSAAIVCAMSTETSSAPGPAHTTEPDASIPDKAEMVAPPGYTIHTENTARILLPSEATAFLNPIQEFNRDLSVACIRTWGKRWDETKREKWERGREARERKRRKSEFGLGSCLIDY